ncbi:MAG: dTDP-4-dehydrorhamnose reductase [Solirubrobacterales bacterium]|jgi:dTDP-4-dehydrorhamnose reductase|nr:dTDP-4-dehydrorhamnose reductase [Solirubrobacterales bacterium]
MKLMVTGAGGMLGHDVVRLAENMRHQVIALTHDDLDVTDPAKVERLIIRERPGAIINCAAWTNVDAAEESEHDASVINSQGAGFVAGAAAKVDAKIIYPSTDYVFNGTGGPYGESDDPDPINAYGRTKLAGERATSLVNGRSFIVRTSWLYGPHGGNFVETMLRLGQGGGPVVVVHDQVGCPTYTGHLAVGLLRLVDSSAYGIHHMAGEGSCSWYEFAMEIFRQAEVVTRVMASTTDMMERPAKRPANSVLISRRSAPIKLPTWQRGLSDYLARREAIEEESPKRQRSSSSRRQPMLDWTRRERQEREADGEEITGETELPLDDVTWDDGSDGADTGQDAA